MQVQIINIKQGPLDGGSYTDRAGRTIYITEWIADILVGGQIRENIVLRAGWIKDSRRMQYEAAVRQGVIMDCYDDTRVAQGGAHVGMMEYKLRSPDPIGAPAINHPAGQAQAPRGNGNTGPSVGRAGSGTGYLSPPPGTKPLAYSATDLGDLMEWCVKRVVSIIGKDGIEKGGNGIISTLFISCRELGLKAPAQAAGAAPAKQPAQRGSQTGYGEASQAPSPAGHEDDDIPF